MTLFVPVYDTPQNQIGLAHKATYLELNKTTNFDPLDTIYAHTHIGEEKKSFTIAYRLAKNEIVYARYKVIFENDLESPFSPIKIITANKAIKEYTLDQLSAVPVTPILSVVDYNHSDVPHEDIKVTISDLRFYMGDGSLVATSWYLKNANDKLLWSSENDKFNLNSIVIPKDNYKEDGIYKIEACRVVRTGLAEYNSLNGVKIITVSSQSGLSNEDKAIVVDYDNFKLYENKQSILNFNQKIKGFEYLSIKVYDRNGVIAMDEIKASKSPVYINTLGLSLGKEYTFRTTAYYTDSIEGIKNTRVESNSFIAEKAPEYNTLMTPDYKDILKLGFKSLKDYRDENIIYPSLTENLNNGEALLFIKDNMLFLGQWLESGMVFNNKFINISKLNYLNTYSKLQIIQKPNGEFLCSFIKGVVGNQDELKVISFRAIDTNNNVQDIEILQEATILTNTDNLNNLNRYVFTNITSQNIIAVLNGTTVTNLSIYELTSNTLVLKASKDYTLTNRLISVHKSGTASFIITALSDGVFKAKNISLTDLTGLDLTIEDIDIEDDTTSTKLLEISNIGLAGGSIKIDGMIIKPNLLFFSIENSSDNVDTRIYQYFKYNINTKELLLVDNISSVGRDYNNKVIYGLNYIKTKLNNPPLRLIAES